MNVDEVVVYLKDIAEILETGKYGTVPQELWKAVNSKNLEVIKNTYTKFESINDKLMGDNFSDFSRHMWQAIKQTIKDSK